MPLKPPPMDECYESFEALKADVQQHAHKQGYAITTKRLKKNKKNEHVIKVILMCNPGQKQHHPEALYEHVYNLHGPAL